MLTRFFRLSVFLIVTLFFVLLFSNLWVIALTSKSIISDSKKLKTGSNLMILGTSKTFASGTENLFFKNRIIAADFLITEIKPANIILSGANPSQYYNEPEDMKNALIQKGIDREFILDHSGDNTRASMLNYKDEFQNQPLIIITQKFHAYRTILICRELNIEAEVYPAEEVSVDITNKPVIREVFARVKALIDFYLL